MSYEINGKSVWDTSKETVVSIIRGLNKGDRVSIFLAADTVMPLIAEPTSDLDVRDRDGEGAGVPVYYIESERCGAGGGRIAESHEQ